MSDLIVEPFTNHLGQTINPGDEVIAVGTSSHSVSVVKAVYDGFRKSERGDIRSVRVSGLKPWWTKLTTKPEWAEGQPESFSQSFPCQRIYKYVP